MSKARTLADAVAAGGAMRLAELATNGTNTVGLSAPNALAADVTWKLPNADGTAGQALLTDGAGNLSWGAGGGGGSAISVSDEGTLLTAGVTSFNFTGAGVTASAVGNAVTVNAPPDLTWQAVQTTGFTAVAGRAYPCNTTSAGFTVTLPASPAAGNLITLTDYAGTWGTNPLIINANGLKINGSTTNVTLSTNRGSVQLVYVDSTQGWVAYSGFAATSLPQVPSTVESLVVAGGGGGVGAGAGSGGGGAGGVLYSASTAVSPATSYTLTVGAGAPAVVNASGYTTTRSSGNPSVFSSITATGGGGGSGGNIAGANGGSGGGGDGGYSSAGGSGTAGQGNAGGSGYSFNANDYRGGGGGGAGGAGASGVTGTGGAGSSYSITGTSLFYGGGGGGGGLNYAGGAGGSSIGGTGGTNTPSNINATNGVDNRGGGGGGGGSASAGGNGGSGVVIIAYPNTFANLASVSAGLTCNGSAGNTTPDTSSRAGYKVYVFTAGTGTISW